MIINPDGWSVLSLLREDGTRSYKIFSSWKHNDEWRLSSGADNLTDITVEGGCVVWPQQSGSIYILPFEGQNLRTNYTNSVLEQKIIPVLTEERIKVTRLDLIQDGQLVIDNIKEFELNEIDNFSLTSCEGLELEIQRNALMSAWRNKQKIVFDSVTESIAIFDIDHTSRCESAQPIHYFPANDELNQLIDYWLEVGLIVAEPNPAITEKKTKLLLPTLVTWDENRHGIQPVKGKELSEEFGLA